MRLKAARWVVLFLCLGLILSLGFGGCSQPSPQTVQPHEADPAGIYPNIKAGEMRPEDAAVVTRWIEDAIALLQSPEFETNFHLASKTYPELFVSRKADVVPSSTIMARLKTRDARVPALWWPESFVILTGGPAVRSPDRTGFGFEASRKAGAGPLPGNLGSGEIELGRLHLARYMRGDVVEKSCAMNTLVHEISHTLSDRRDQFWMHILDSEEDVTAPGGYFEASYFIGTIAQCTYLQTERRINAAGFQDCILTFSNPNFGSRFKSLACDDFPNQKPITPQGRLNFKN